MAKEFLVSDVNCSHASWECTMTYQKGVVWHRCDDCGFNWRPDPNKASFHGGPCSKCIDSTEFVTKDSGKREEYDSGMVRDTQDGKPRYDLLLPDGVPYGHQFLTRVAGLLARGAEKYSDRNWEQASGDAELARFKSSAFRHLMQWITGESDEDHAAATCFNLLAYETIKWKRDNAPK